MSPNAAAATPGKSPLKNPFDTKAGEIPGGTDGDGDSDPIDLPVLLRRLTPSASRDHGGAVGGILFQRVLGAAGSGCAVVLASVAGTHRHTRLHSFRSKASSPAGLGGVGASSTLRSAFEGGSQSSFVELPGSVDFAELRSCGDGFAVRTETGIYYGVVSASGTSPAGGGGGIGGAGAGAGAGGGYLDAGMLDYDTLKLGASSSGRQPASIGLTPHHFITLSSANEVRFVNRVAKKVIQEERVDWVSLSQTSSSSEDALQHGSSWGGVSVAELLTDVRRPDQIWLRKGRSLVHISSSHEDRDGTYYSDVATYYCLFGT